MRRSWEDRDCKIPRGGYQRQEEARSGERVEKLLLVGRTAIQSVRSLLVEHRLLLILTGVAQEPSGGGGDGG